MFIYHGTSREAARQITGQSSAEFKAPRHNWEECVGKSYWNVPVTSTKEAKTEAVEKSLVDATVAAASSDSVHQECCVFELEIPSDLFNKLFTEDSHKLKSDNVRSFYVDEKRLTEAIKEWGLPINYKFAEVYDRSLRYFILTQADAGYLNFNDITNFDRKLYDAMHEVHVRGQVTPVIADCMHKTFVDAANKCANEFDLCRGNLCNDEYKSRMDSFS